MKLLERRRAAEAAVADLDRRYGTWLATTDEMRRWCGDHRGLLIVGGGAVGGALFAHAPIQALARLASLASAVASLSPRLVAMAMSGAERAVGRVMADGP